MNKSTKNEKPSITVEAIVAAPIEKVWKFWTEPSHIQNWCSASDDWYVPAAENDLKVGGKFSTTMSAKDKSFSFDFNGVYTEVKHHETITYTTGDGRKVMISFSDQGKNTKIVETFEAEKTNSLEMQKDGWQSILDNFKKYTEIH
ncbi:SRPBCC family protein [Albibacterium bauzanense]|uniref:Uncharacterized protein YndB with AHSA1/START domain n=1 Tax=Albibacterium bauzanense TaxID=653929 RepID=A0A4R1M2F6_9SPHI|nr:SRPBCC family protein [Albibacterium bauzanense]TCK85392.1 uncharacterized protein YndB with AHSA1/START domain [Albibacterium bauzanense]